MKSFASLLAALAAMPAAAAQQPPPTANPSGTSQVAPGERRFDTVAHASVGEGTGYRAAVRGLEAGSYAEVTALDSGKTVLVVADDGADDDRVSLSGPAAAALGIVGPGAVRVRRVTPTPQDVVALREGQAASERLAAPPALLKALRNRLPAAPVHPAPVAKVTPPPTETVAKPHPEPTPNPAAKPAKAVTPPKPAPAPVASPKPEATPAKAATPPKPAPAPVASPKPAPAASSGSYIVQVAALSNAASAEALARKLGGSVSASGKLHRVRLGPFADRAAATKARAKAVAAGYRDSTIQTNRQ